MQRRRAPELDLDRSGSAYQISIVTQLTYVHAEIRRLREETNYNLHHLPERLAEQMVLQTGRVTTDTDQTGTIMAVFKMGMALYANLRRVSVLFSIWTMVAYGAYNSGQIADLLKWAIKETIRALIQG